LHTLGRSSTSAYTWSARNCSRFPFRVAVGIRFRGLRIVSFALKVESVMSEWVAASCCTKVKPSEGQCELIAQWTLVHLAKADSARDPSSSGPGLEGPVSSKRAYLA
jgi:hypothetical protein